MIPVWISDTARNSFSYNDLTFNQIIDGDERDIIEIARVQFLTPIEHALEAKEFADGVEAYGAFARGKRFVMHGIVRASSRGALYDRMEEMSGAFHPAMLARDNPDTFGFLPFDFQVPTADTVNFVSGLMDCRYYARPEQAFEPPSSAVQGLAVPFILPFFAPDMRRYLQTASTLSGSGTAANTIATTWSWPTLTITMSGAGASNFRVSNSANDLSLTLNLSGRSNGEVVVVDMERRTIKVNDIEMAGLYVSGDYFGIESGGNIIAYTNNTNASPVLSWRPAFSF